MAGSGTTEAHRAGGRKRRDLETELLEAARDVFGQRGYEATRVEDILVAANVSRQSFYKSFESKSAVFLRLVRDDTDQLISSITDDVAAAETPPAELRAAIDAYFRWIVRLGPFHRVIESQNAVPGSAAAAIRWEAICGLRELLAERAKKMLGFDVDTLVVEALVATIEGIGRHLLEKEDDALFEPFAQIALEIVWRSVVPADFAGFPELKA